MRENPILFKDKTYACTFEITMDLIGSKWKPLILWHIGNHQVLRFSELKKLMPNITPKMLTQQLRDLETDDIINRKVYPVVPPKVEYTLTDCGNKLMPILSCMCQWGRAYYADHSQNERQPSIQLDTQLDK